MHKMTNMSNGYFLPRDLEFAHRAAGDLVNKSIKDFQAGAGRFWAGAITFSEALRHMQASWREVVEMLPNTKSAAMGRRMVAAYAYLARQHEADKQRCIQQASDSFLA